MKTLLLVFFALTQDTYAASPKYAPVNGSTATALSSDNAYLRGPDSPAADFWALSSFYVPQHNGYACSAASVAMALNALLNTGRTRGDEEENIDQRTIPDKVKGFDWAGLLGEKGSGGRHGVTLAQLGQAAGEALGALSPGRWKVEVATAPSLQDFRKALEANERGGKDIILLHFVQDALTGAAGGPYAHVSPVGAYDAGKRRVLIMDVDRQWYEPYWADDAQVARAMGAETRAFGRGGFVFIKPE